MTKEWIEEQKALVAGEAVGVYYSPDCESTAVKNYPKTLEALEKILGLRGIMGGDDYARGTNSMLRIVKQIIESVE